MPSVLFLASKNVGAQADVALPFMGRPFCVRPHM